MVHAPKNRDVPPRIGELIVTPNTTLAHLVKYADSLTRLETLLARNAGSDLAEQFQVAAIRQNRLVLLTPSAAWATRLRMLSSQMLEGLQGTDYSHLEHIDIRIAPLSRDPVRERTPRKRTAAAERAFTHMSRILGKKTE